MATKISQDISFILLHEHKYHKIKDVYTMLAKLSTELKVSDSKLFVILTNNNSRYNLAKTVQSYVKSIKSTETVISSLKRLEELDLLEYSELHNAWILKHMENMFDKEGGGYMDLSEVLFSDEYYALPYLERKITFYALYLMAKKGFKKFKEIHINLVETDSSIVGPNVMKDRFKLMFNTDNVYYLSNCFKSVINNFFVNISELKRELEIKKRAFVHLHHKRKASRKLKFKYFFKASSKIKTSIGRRKKTPDEAYRKYRESDPMFYGYLQKIAKLMDADKPNALTLDIQLQLLRQCAALHYIDKQKITARITYQLQKGNVFISSAKYIQTTIQNYMLEQCI